MQTADMHYYIISNTQCLLLAPVALSGDINMLKMIVSKRHKDFDSLSMDMKATMDDIFQAYVIVCEQNRCDMITTLLGDHDYIHINHIFIVACDYACIDVVRFLIDKGADNFNEGLRRAIYKYKLHQYRSNNNLEVIKLLSSKITKKQYDILKVCIDLYECEVLKIITDVMIERETLDIETLQACTAYAYDHAPKDMITLLQTLQKRLIDSSTFIVDLSNIDS